MATNTYATLTEEQSTFYDKVLLKRLLPNLVFAKYGQTREIPKNTGDKINFRRFDSLNANTTALTEGVTPTGKDLSVSKVEATLKQYGDFVEVSDKITLMGIDPVLTETSELLGEQAGNTIDTVIRDIVSVGTNVQYAGGKTSTETVTATDVLTLNEVAKAVRTLRAKNAKPYDGTYFIGIISPETAFDLMYTVDAKGNNLWQDVSKYSSATQIFEGEIGKMAGVRFIETSNIKTGTGASSCKVFMNMIIGKDAYGTVNFNGNNKPKVIVKALGSAGSSDPLDQRCTAGWKAFSTAARLNELAMIRIESSATQ